MNKLIVSGNLGKDAEIKEAMANNRQFITFPIANTEKINGVDQTTWFQCFIHNQNIVGSTLINYLKKGTKVLIMGHPTAEIWNKPDGTNVITHTITVHQIELMGSIPGNHQPVEQMAASQAPGQPQQSQNTDVENDDDLPF